MSDFFYHEGAPVPSSGATGQARDAKMEGDRDRRELNREGAMDAKKEIIGGLEKLNR